MSVSSPVVHVIRREYVHARIAFPGRGEPHFLAINGDRAVQSQLAGFLQPGSLGTKSLSRQTIPRLSEIAGPGESVGVASC